MISAFKGWVDKGYRKFLATGHNESGFHSWRFWARGDRKGHIACGIGRDSSDGLGRPYPFLSIGMGSLPGWEARWDLVPFALEKQWGHMEYLAAKRHKDFGAVKEGLKTLKGPVSRWSEWESPGGAANRTGETRVIPVQQLESGVEALRKRGDLFVEINEKTTQGQSDMIHLWHAGLRSKFGAVPNAVFVGGGPNRIQLVVFTRALAPSDFVRLWSV